MEAIKFKYKEHIVEIIPLNESKTEKNMFIHISKDGNLIFGRTFNASLPYEDVIDLIETMID